MTTRTTAGQSEHDRVVRASATTYEEWIKKGYKVSVNLGGEKNQFVGPPFNPRYPDIVVWMPDYFGSTSGKAAIIEEVETAESIADSEAEQWKDYGDLGVKFLLIVPNGYCIETLRLVAKYGVNVSEIWYYYFEYGGNIKFEKYE